MADDTESGRDAWRTLSRELHVWFCMDLDSSRPEPDWQAAESCTAFAAEVLASSWLAARDAAVAERAWNEGQAACGADWMRGYDAQVNGEPCPPPTPNPYRERP